MQLYHVPLANQQLHLQLQGTGQLESCYSCPGEHRRHVTQVSARGYMARAARGREGPEGPAARALRVGNAMRIGLGHAPAHMCPKRAPQGVYMLSSQLWPAWIMYVTCRMFLCVCFVTQGRTACLQYQYTFSSNSCGCVTLLSLLVPNARDSISLLSLLLQPTLPLFLASSPSTQECFLKHP